MLLAYFPLVLIIEISRETNMEEAIRSRENYYRKLFAVRRTHPSLNDPHLMLHNVFQMRNTFHFESLSDDTVRLLPPISPM